MEVLNAGVALNYGGLAIGCVFFIPLAHKFGRRPLYILSAMLQTASCIWGARIQTAGDQIGSGFVTGIGSSISETIVQMTVADIFFVHQHGTMNAWYGFFQSIGAFLGPVAAGYITNSQGWRWTWWWCVIFIGTTLVIVTVFLEESKYVPIQDCHGPSTPKAIHDPKESTTTKTEIELAPGQPAAQIRPKSYLQRMKLITKTDEPILVHFYQPLVSLVTFPAVAYCAITYGFTFCWFAIMNSLLATYIFGPPWHFTANTVGLFHIPPFIGGTIGYVYGGYLCDRWIMRLSKRNNGIYEPEMRLWLALPIAIIYPAGILMFGLGLAYVCILRTWERED